MTHVRELRERDPMKRCRLLQPPPFPRMIAYDTIAGTQDQLMMAAPAMRARAGLAQIEKKVVAIRLH